MENSPSLPAPARHLEEEHHGARAVVGVDERDGHLEAEIADDDRGVHGERADARLREGPEEIALRGKGRGSKLGEGELSDITRGKEGKIECEGTRAHLEDGSRDLTAVDGARSEGCRQARRVVGMAVSQEVVSGP